MAIAYSKKLRASDITFWLVPPTLASLFCFLTLPYSYPLFHMLAEFSSISVGIISLVLAIVLLNLTRHRFIAYIGIGLGWTASLDFIHMLAYEGMAIVQDDNVNVAAQFWLSARFLNGFVLLTAPLYITRNFSTLQTNLGMAAYCLLSILLIETGYFPRAFVDGDGLTEFKIYSEYLIILTYIVAATLYHSRRHLISRELLLLIYCALSFCIVSEFLFTLYGSATDTLNALGHIAKVFAYWFIFLAIVRFSLQHPLNSLFQSANVYDLVIDAVLVTGPSGEIVEANEAAGRMLYKNKKTLLGDSAHNLFHASNPDKDSCPICTKLKENAASLEVRVNAEGKYYDIYAKSIDDHHDSLASLQLIRDVTEQADYQGKIEQKRILLEKLSEQVPGVIYQYRLNPDGSSCFPFSTEQMKNIYGLSPEELESDASPVFAQIHEDDLPAVTESIQKSAENLSVWNQEYRVHLKDKGTVWRSGHATPEKLEDGSVLWHGFISDSTRMHTINEELKQRNEDLRKSVEATIEIVENMVQVRDPYTAGHEQRVGSIARQIAEKLGWPGHRCEQLKMIGAVHDVGKIAVPAEILSKPNKLTKDEYSLIKEHARVGYDILSPIKFDFPLAQTVLQHHERLDGSGYPQGLKGDEIIGEAKILAVADVFESMTSHRPYRPARTFKEAIDELRTGRSTLYDPEAVDALLELVENGKLQLA